MEITGFHALATADVEQMDGGRARLTVHELGTVKVPSGRLGACDPFVDIEQPLPLELPEPGEYPVFVTVADVSEAQDGSHLREAYLSVVIAEGEAVALRPAAVAEMDDDEDEDDDDDQVIEDGEPMYGIPVDSGTVAFVDADAVDEAMPEDTEPVFDSGKDDSWFALMDSAEHFREGCANIVMPLAENGENVVLAHSGWGDGFYPVVATFDADDKLLAIHIDLLVVGAPGYPEPSDDEDFDELDDDELEEDDSDEVEADEVEAGDEVTEAKA